MPDRVIVPKSRFCLEVSSSDLTTLALAWIVVCAACADASGTAPSRASAASLDNVDKRLVTGSPGFDPVCLAKLLW